MCDADQQRDRYVDTVGAYRGSGTAETTGPPAKIPSGFAPAAAPPARKPKRKAS